MELSKRTSWRIALTRGGKTRYVKLLGGAGASDEVVAFGLALEAGDHIRVVSGPRSLGYEDLTRDDCNSTEENKDIVVVDGGVYDFHLDTSKFGGERISILTPGPQSEELAATQKRNLGRMRRKKAKEITLTILHNVLIAALVFIWLIPIFWLILVSFTGEVYGPSTLYHFFPQVWSIENYVKILTDVNEVNQFPRWFGNTLLVSVCSTIVSTLFVLATAFAFSRFQFKKRKGFMNISMVIALFPGMLTMFVSYTLFEYVFHINSGLVRLIIAYSAGAGLGYLVAKGFFDTIPHEIDEAAKIDGASKARIFFQILVPLSKPIIVYTIITAFMSPWVDFVFARIILGPSTEMVQFYTVALGLMNLVDGDNALFWFGAYTAGSVIIALPLSILFIIFQKYYVGGVTGGAVKG